jgi:hypothetical protein
LLGGEHFCPFESTIRSGMRHSIPLFPDDPKKGSSRISGKAIANTGFNKKNLVLA